MHAKTLNFVWHTFRGNVNDTSSYRCLMILERLVSILACAYHYLNNLVVGFGILVITLLQFQYSVVRFNSPSQSGCIILIIDMLSQRADD